MSSQSPYEQAGVPPPPPSPPAPPPPVARQLVRDPFAKLGGVASGISHHYGIDVSLVRIAFVVFTLASGFGILIYFLAWLIIPRAEYWPPVSNAKPIRALSGREIGVGLVLLGALVGLFFSGGAVSQVLVPLVLVAGGIWMLLQPDAEEALSGPSARAPQAFQPVDSVRVDTQPIQDSVLQDSVPQDSVPQNSAPQDSVPPGLMPPGLMARGTPVVVPRRRWRKRLLLIPFLAVLAIPLILVVVATNIEIDLARVDLKPESAELLPTSIVEEQAELVLDLTELTPEMFEDGPRTLSIQVDFGTVEVIVPEDLVIDVEADVGIGDLQVFSRGKDGIGSDITVTNEDPQIMLDASVEIGSLEVRRAGDGG